jgi:DNA repair protein RadC
MEKIKDLPLPERPREKLIYKGTDALSDEEILAILLGSANLIPCSLPAIAQMDIKALCAFKGIGPAKAAVLLAAAEYSRRAATARSILKDEQAFYETLRPLLARATQLQYILLLISVGRELLAFSEAGSVLPDIARITELAIRAGAGRLLLARNGWPVFSNTESRYLHELQSACAALGILCEGLMTVGSKRFKMI